MKRPGHELGLYVGEKFIDESFRYLSEGLCTKQSVPVINIKLA